MPPWRGRWAVRAPGCACARPAPQPTPRARLASPLRIRDASTVFAGALAGLAGAHLALGLVGLFDEGMVAGRGFIALAAFYFGRARPWPTAPGARCSAVRRAQIRLQQEGVASRADEMVPYLVVIVVLADRARRPARSAARRRPCTTPEGGGGKALMLVDVIRAFFERTASTTTPGFDASKRR